jgi:uncharacterized protein
MERRYLSGSVEAESGKLVGYAAVFGSLSRDLGGFREIIAPGAFTRTLEENRDITALWDHDTRLLLGRVPDSLTLREDSHGLRVEIDLPDTTYAKDLAELVRTGRLHGMSFGFIVPKGGDEFTMSGDTLIRTLNELELYEVSAVTNPAYANTTIDARELRERLQRPNQTARLRLRLADL